MLKSKSRAISLVWHPQGYKIAAFSAGGQRCGRLAHKPDCRTVNNFDISMRACRFIVWRDEKT
jgi:hypothetical protein